MKKNKRKQKPPYQNEYPFVLDDKVLEQIGFAAGCFENYLLLDDDMELDRRRYEFLLNRFVLACMMGCQDNNCAYDNTGNGYSYVTNMLEACCGVPEKPAEEPVNSQNKSIAESGIKYAN